VLSIDVVTAPTSSSVYYILVDPPLTMPFKFSEFPKCGLNYSLSPSVKFATVDSQLQQLTINSLDVYDFGIHHIKLIAVPPKFGVSKEVPFKVDMVHFCAVTEFIPNRIASIEVFKQDPMYSPFKQILF
jgi:hypothetical protein